MFEKTLKTVRSSAVGILSNKRTMLIILVAALFIAAAVWTYNKYVAPRVNVAYAPNKEFVEKGSGKDDVADLYFFYTDWCPHCKTAKPVMAKLKEYIDSEGGKIKGVKINMIYVDCEKDSETADRYNVEGYPTIKLVYGNKVIEYDAKPDLDTLKQFLNSSL